MRVEQPTTDESETFFEIKIEMMDDVMHINSSKYDR
jgi:hypothetical protein